MEELYEMLKEDSKIVQEVLLNIISGIEDQPYRIQVRIALLIKLAKKSEQEINMSIKEQNMPTKTEDIEIITDIVARHTHIDAIVTKKT